MQNMKSRKAKAGEKEFHRSRRGMREDNGCRMMKIHCMHVPNSQRMKIKEALSIIHELCQALFLLMYIFA